MKKTWLTHTDWLVLMFVLVSCAAAGKNEQSIKEGMAYRRVGEAYMQQGNIAAAMQEFKKAEEKNPDDYLLQYDLGLIYYSRERFDEAIGHYQKAIDLKADYGPAINSMGNAYAGKKDWDKAIFYYNKSIDDILYATPHFTYAGLGNAYYYKGDLELSEKNYLEALQIKPEFVNALQGLARTYIAMGRLPEAVEKLEKAVRIMPDSPALHLQLAKAYQQALEFQKAYNSYRKVVELAPESLLADEAAQAARKVKDLF